MRVFHLRQTSAQKHIHQLRQGPTGSGSRLVQQIVAAQKTLTPTRRANDRRQSAPKRMDMMMTIKDRLPPVQEWHATHEPPAILVAMVRMTKKRQDRTTSAQHVWLELHALHRRQMHLFMRLFWVGKTQTRRDTVSVTT